MPEKEGRGRIYRESGLDDPSGLDAAGADTHPFDPAFMDTSDLLKIGIPPAFCLVVRVTDVVTDNRFFTADFTDF